MAANPAEDSDGDARAEARPPSRWRRVALALALCVGMAVSAVHACATRSATTSPDRSVRDVTQLVRIPVERVVAPRDAEEVRDLVRSHDGPISIGGGRFSMGGQIGTENTLFLDMREMDDVLALDIENKRIRVEAGATWRKLQEAIDPHDLSISIMQSYANFTVGGSLSVNAHGRYVNSGPLVQSVQAIDLVLADGSLVRATPTEHSELFHGAIGGYGALGVITAAELALADNEPLERSVDRIPMHEFRAWFDREIRGSDDAVFFNADLYPPDYDDMLAITFSRSARDVTIADRMQTPGGSTAADRISYWWVSEGPLGKEARAKVIDRMRLAGRPVVWRNYEASYDVAELEPRSREKSTYVLQEYFIPVENFDRFVPKMAEIFQRYDVNVINVSIRHASADSGTMLAWAQREVYAFVVYYKQKTGRADQTEVGIWTREMVDAILSEQGTYYLPYQIHPTEAQFHAAYPRAHELFALKARVDPDYKFRNKLWDAYLPPPDTEERLRETSAIGASLRERPGYLRPEDQTFLTVPEWYIVYSADELGAHLRSERPSAFPFFASVGQFWEVYDAVSGSVDGRYAFNTGYHVMIAVIGASYSVEYAIKGLYEGSIGRLSEWWSDGQWQTQPEDRFYAELAAEYGAFIHHTPWYAFPYAERRARLGEVGADNRSLRGLERRIAVWLELAGKSLWSSVIALGTESAYGVETQTIEAWVQPGHADPASLAGATLVEQLGEHDALIALPRYEPFTRAVPVLVEQGVRFVEIAGGRTIALQVVAPASWERARLWGDVVVAWPILTEPNQQRVVIEVAVARLHEVIPALEGDGVRLEHVYDY